MPRGERALEGVGALTEFAADLRTLRQKAGSPPYRKLASMAHYSATTLADAAGGQRLPSLAVLLAYVRACGGEVAEWEARWNGLAAALAGSNAESDGSSGGDGNGGALSAEDVACPYVGLAAFGPMEAGWFFGREVLTDELVLKTRTHRFTAVSGPSGSGKSSLLRAGLLPRLGQNGKSGEQCESSSLVVLLTPGSHPLDQCAIRLAGLGGGSASVLRRELLAEPRALHLAVSQVLAARGEAESADLVLVVDQFEEVFTLCADTRERAAFISALLVAAGATNSRTRVVIGIRADFLGHCAQYPELVDAMRDAQVTVAPMSTDELRRAVSMPAAAAGSAVEGALLARVVVDAVGQPNALPLVSHALRETWRRRRGNTLTLAGYEASGGIHYALARTAEALYENLTEAQQALARGIFLRLVALGDGTEDTKRRLARAELAEDSVGERPATGESPTEDSPADLGPVLETLAGARLITLDAEGIELTHEALLHAWPRLRTWINEDRAGLLIRQQIGDAAAAWEREGRDQSALYRGDRLAAAHDLARRAGDTPLGARARQFLAASQRHERRASRIRRTALVAISTLALVATVFAVFAFQQRASAQSERDDAIAGEVLAEAEQLQSSDPSLAAQLTLASYRFDPTDDGYTDLLNTENVALSNVLTGHTGTVFAVAYSPNGKVLATGGADGTVRLWHTGADDTSLWTAPIDLHAGHVYWLAFSPDGRTLATADGNDTVQLWNVGDPAHPVAWRAPLTGHTGHVYSVSFSADGRVLASAGFDHTVRLWNVANPAAATEIGSPIVEKAVVASASFSPVGSTLSISGHDGTVRLMDVANPAQPIALGTPLTWDGTAVSATAISPDGKTLAEVGSPYNVRLWNISDPAHPVPLGVPLTGHTDIVYAAAFSPDGRILATAGADQTIRLWNLSDPADPVEIGQPLVGHSGYIYWLAFSPDGHTLASASADHTVRLWNIPATVLPGGGHSNNVAYSPDGHTLVTLSSTDGVSLWNVANPAEPVLDARLPGSAAQKVDWIAFSPDGASLATAGSDGAARLWNVEDPAQPVAWGPPLLPGGGHVDMAVFSPNGRYLATGSADGTVRLWDVANRARAVSVGTPLRGLSPKFSWIGFSPDGRTLIGTDSNSMMQIWNVADPARATPIGAPVNRGVGAVELAAFSPDGNTLATADYDYTVRLWNVADPARVAALGPALTGHTSWVYWVGFSPDGKLLASTSGDDTVRLWNVADPAHVSELGHPLTDHTNEIFNAAFSPDGRVLATASKDGTVELTQLGADQAAAHVCAASGDTLTRAAWSRYVPDLPYNPPCAG
jgi:WD40 repeat protein